MEIHGFLSHLWQKLFCEPHETSELMARKVGGKLLFSLSEMPSQHGFSYTPRLLPVKHQKKKYVYFFCFDTQARLLQHTRTV